jgi:aconitase B
MGKIQSAVSKPTVKACSPEDLFRAKKARRARLAALPVDEKIDLIEKLRDAGRDLIRARETLGMGSARKGRKNLAR